MKKLFFSILILLVVVVVLKAFFINSSFVDVHDPTAIYRVSTLSETLLDGQFPAAWHNSLNNGYGYPLSLYYAPAFTYLSAFVSIFTFGNYVLATKLAIVIVTIVGTIGVYKLMAIYGVLSATLASIAFLTLPYHASALYVRGSYAEYFTISLLPWVVYYFTNPINSKKKISYASLILALFMLTHNTLPFLILPILLFYILFVQKSNLKNSLLSVLLAFMLGSAFLAPTLFERSFVQVEQIAAKTSLFDHFVSPAQLWYSSWGYGGSTVGDSDLMSFMLGKGQLILALLGIGLAVYRRNIKLVLITLPLLLTIVLTHSSSAWLWQLFPVLSVIQFPWRVLGITTLSLSLLAGYSANLFSGKLKVIITLILIFFLIKTNISYFKPWNYLDYNSDILTNSNNLYPLVKDKIPEYLPIWTPEFTLTPRPSDTLMRTATRATGRVIIDSTSNISLSTAYMPHWRLMLNGVTTEIIPTNQGLITTKDQITPGEYDLSLTWHSTNLEKLGYLLSLIAIFIMIGLSL